MKKTLGIIVASLLSVSFAFGGNFSTQMASGMTTTKNQVTSGMTNTAGQVTSRISPNQGSITSDAVDEQTTSMADNGVYRGKTSLTQTTTAVVQGGESTTTNTVRTAPLAPQSRGYNIHFQPNYAGDKSPSSYRVYTENHSNKSDHKLYINGGTNYIQLYAKNVGTTNQTKLFYDATASKFIGGDRVGYPIYGDASSVFTMLLASGDKKNHLYHHYSILVGASGNGNLRFGIEFKYQPTQYDTTTETIQFSCEAKFDNTNKKVEIVNTDKPKTISGVVGFSDNIYEKTTSSSPMKYNFKPSFYVTQNSLCFNTNEMIQGETTVQKTKLQWTGRGYKEVVTSRRKEISKLFAQPSEMCIEWNWEL